VTGGQRSVFGGRLAGEGVEPGAVISGVVGWIERRRHPARVIVASSRTAMARMVEADLQPRVQADRR
jgi:hypothetical protein